MSSPPSVVLQERMVNMVNQLAMPLVETSMVVSRWCSRVLERLQYIAQTNNETLPDRILKPWEFSGDSDESGFEFDLQRVLDIIDNDRMEILDTLISATIEEQRLPLFDVMLMMRSWEQVLRERLIKVKSPGQLFSPVDLPEEF